MELLISPNEQRSFLQILRNVQEAGWPDGSIARELKVSNGDLKDMLSGSKPPNPQHITRVRDLARTGPPRRTPPPAPSGPLVTPPDFQPTRRNGEPSPGSSMPREIQSRPQKLASIPPTPVTAPKETRPMQQTVSPSKVINRATERNTEGMTNPRYHLLGKKDSTDLRREMNGALKSHFGGSVVEMARAVGLTSNGLRKLLTKKAGSISQQTKNTFETIMKAPKRTVSVVSSATPTAPRKSSPSPTELKQFRKGLQAEIEKHSRNSVAKAMGVAPTSLALILSGHGTTHSMISKFEAYKNAGTSNTAKNGTVKETAAESFDLYGLAGRLLAQGKDQQALVMSLVAQVSEAVPLAQIAAALRPLQAQRSP